VCEIQIVGLDIGLNVVSPWWTLSGDNRLARSSVPYGAENGVTRINWHHTLDSGKLTVNARTAI
jgi:hypothetical protein